MLLLHCNHTQQGGYTALYIAAQDGQIEIVSLLLDRGANIDVATDVSHGRALRISTS